MFKVPRAPGGRATPYYTFEIRFHGPFLAADFVTVPAIGDRRRPSQEARLLYEKVEHVRGKIPRSRESYGDLHQTRRITFITIGVLGGLIWREKA
jgi:hypothetical protein